MAWMTDIEGNLINLEQCAIIRAVKIPNSDMWKILAYAAGCESPFSVLRETTSKRELDICSAMIAGFVNSQKIDIGTVN